MKKVLMKSKHVVLLLLIMLLTIGLVGVTSNDNVVNAETNNVTVEKNYFSLDYSNNELTLLFSPSLNAYANIQKGDLTELKNAILSVANDIIFTKTNDTDQKLKNKAIRKNVNNVGNAVDVSLVSDIIKGQITDIEVVEADILEFGTYDTLLKFYVDRYTNEYVKNNPIADVNEVLDKIAEDITTSVNEKVNEIYEAEGLGEYAPTADVESKIQDLITEVKDLKAEDKSVEITLTDVSDVFNTIGYSDDVVNVIKTIDASTEINNVLVNATGDEITDFFTEVDIDQLIEVTKETNIIVKDNISEIASKVGIDNIVKIADAVGTDKLKEFAKVVDIDSSDVNDMIKDNLKNIKFIDLFKVIKSVKINNELVYNNKEVMTGAIKNLLKELPKLSEIANYTDEQMRLSWNVEIDTIVGTKSFKFTVGFNGDCSKIRRLAELVARYVDFNRVNGVYHLDVRTPIRLSDFILAASNTDKISDSLKQKVFNALSLNVNDVYELIQDLTMNDIINILKKVDYKKIVNKLIDADVLNKYFHTTAFTDSRIDKIINELIKVGQKAQKITYSDIESVMTKVLGTNVLENTRLETYINQVLNLFDKVNFDNLSAERIRNFADPNSSSTNEKIYEYLDKLVRFEDEFNKAKELLTKVYNKLPERFKSKSLFDFYKGEGEFKYDGSFVVENILNKISTEKYNIRDIITMLFDYLPESISVSLDLKAANIYKVDYVIGSTTKSGFLPVGANLQFFAQTTELNGHTITKWVDEDNNVYETMPEKDIVLYAVTEFSILTSEDINKTYDGTSSVISVTVEGDAKSYSYQWYKDGAKIEGATSSEYLVTNVKDSGKYYCAVTSETGYNESREISVVINKVKVDVSGFKWTSEDDLVYNGNMHTVKLVSVPSVLEVTYTNNTGINAGKYYAEATFTLVDSDNYELVVDTLHYDWEIEASMISVPTPEWSIPSSQVYNGSAFKAYIMNLPEGVIASYTNDEFTNVGTYKTIVTLSTDENHVLSVSEVEYEWQITPLEIRISNLQWSVAASQVYNGNEFVAVITNLPEAVVATYTNNKGVNVGTYTTTVTLTTDENHKLTRTTITYTWKVTPLEITVPELEWSNSEVVYSGNEVEVTITNLPEGVTATYTNNKKVNASNYTAVAVLSVDSNHMIAKTTYTHDWKITPLVVTITENDLTWAVNDSVVYSGSEIKNTITNLPSYVSAMYSNNKATNVGEYTTSVVLSVDANHKLTQNRFTKTWSITKLEISVSDLVWTVKASQVYSGKEFEATITNLPEGVEVVYANNKGVNVGTYTTVATLTVDNNHTISSNEITFEWTITPLEIVVNDLVWSVKANEVYSGNELVATITNLPEGVEVVYANNKGVNVGTYTTVATLSVDSNHTISSNEITFEWKITPLEITLPDAVWTVKATQVYNGNELVATITNLPAGVEVVYANNKGVNVGTYTTVATLSVDDNHSIKNNTITFEWKITPLEIILPDAIWSVKATQVYNGNELEATITNLPAGVEVVYANNKGVNVGTYTTVATLSVDDNHYINNSTITFEWKITPVVIYLTSVTWNYLNAFVYDGNTHEVKILNLPEGVSVEYQDNKAMSVGVYTAVATLSTDKNHTLSKTVFTLTWEIKSNAAPVDTKKNFEGLDGTIKVIAKNGVASDNTLNVSDVTESTKDVDLSTVLGNKEKGQVKYAYDIHFEKDGTEVTVKDDFTIRMLIPEELLNKNIKVIHIDDAGNITDVEFEREGNYVVFSAEHFSIFAIVQVAKTNSVPWIIWVIVALLVIFIIGLVVAIYMKRNQNDNEISDETLAEVEAMLASEEEKSTEDNVEDIDSDEIPEEEKVSFEEEKPVEIPEPENESDKFEDSYFGNLINSEDDTKGYYAILKKEILSYSLDDQNVETKISWNNETFMINDEMVARFKMRNNKLYVSLPLNPSEYLDASEIKDADTTFSCCIKNGRRCKYTKGLISVVMNKYGLTKRSH